MIKQYQMITLYYRKKHNENLEMNLPKNMLKCKGNVTAFFIVLLNGDEDSDVTIQKPCCSQQPPAPTDVVWMWD